MTPFKFELNNPEFGIVVHCKKYLGIITRAYYLSEESSGHTTIWRSCLTNEEIDGEVMNAYLLLHLIGKIRCYYPNLNFS